MGIDTNIAYESAESDATVAQVVRWRDNKIVCTYEARVPAHILINQLYFIYRWYFNCYYAPETKGMGYALVRGCIERGMRNVYYYKRLDRDHPEMTPYPGWDTNSRTRPLMDQTATELICRRDPSNGKPEPDIIPDAKTLHEIRNLGREPSGAFKSRNGTTTTTTRSASRFASLVTRSTYLHRTKHEAEEEKRAEFETNCALISSGSGTGYGRISLRSSREAPTKTDPVASSWRGSCRCYSPRRTPA